MQGGTTADSQVNCRTYYSVHLRVHYSYNLFPALSIRVRMSSVACSERSCGVHTHGEVLLRNINLECVVRNSDVEQILRQLRQGGLPYVLHCNVNRLHHRQTVLSHALIVSRDLRVLFEKREEWLNLRVGLEQPAHAHRHTRWTASWKEEALNANWMVCANLVNRMTPAASNPTPLITSQVSRTSFASFSVRGSSACKRAEEGAQVEGAVELDCSE